MANLCSFTMKIKGSSKENLLTFCEMMDQKGNIWMGRGAEICSDIDIEDNNDGTFALVIDGWCKWSIEAALILNAISMRENPKMWSFGNSKDVEQNLKFLTLYEACEELGLTMEAFSEEPGCGFGEHITYINGKGSCETTPYSEEYDEEEEDYVSIGGYEWNFEI